MRRILFACLASLTLSLSALAQSSTGRLVGTVSSPDGVLPGATVVVKDDQTGKEQTLTANEEGSFELSQLEAGTYVVTITAQGFKTFVATNLKIDVGREYSLNPTLEIGSVSENVEVIAGADIVNSTTAELSSTVSPRQVLELPLNGRNPLSLISLQPGASPNRGNGSEIINGGRTSSTNFTRDGINVQDVFIRNGFVADNPTVDNTGEFTVTTQNAGAESGYGSSQIQLVTPRGGQDYHGALFIYNRNSKFTANNFFSNAAGRYTSTDAAVIQGRAVAGELRQPRSFLNRNQFGGKIGGPLPLPYFGEGTPGLLKDKAFFFFTYEKFLLRQQAAVTRTILRPDARSGIFAYRPTTTPPAGRCITFSGGVCTVNVLTGAGLTGPIPAASQGVLPLDPLIQNRFISQTPTAGNRSDIGDQLNTIGLGFNQSDPEDRREFTGRIDAELNERNSINGVYRFNQTTDARTDIDTSFNQVARANTDAPVKFLALAWISSPSSNFTNEARGGFIFQNVGFFNQVLPNEPFLLGTLGPNLGTLGLNLTSPEVTFRDQGRKTRTLTVQNNSTYILGQHSLRFGGNVQTFKVLSFGQGGVGIPTYTLATVANPNTPRLPASLFPGGISTNDQGNADALRYLLGGIVGGGTIGANVTSTTSGFVPGAALDRRLKYETFAFYAGDQWRVTPSLVLNYGLRYEYYTSLRTTDGLYLEPVLGNDAVGAVLNPSGTYDFVGRNSGEEGGFVIPDKDNFAPNFSFAYSPTFKNKFLGSVFGSEEEKTTLRGGIRVGYVNDEYIRSIDNAVGQNAGLTATASALQGSGASASSLINARFNALPPPVVPTYITPPRTYADNNTAGFQRFGTVFAVDPKLQLQRTFEYNVGIQREIGFQTAIEVRYVGAMSNQLVRTIDYNQIDIRANGFGADFLRAVQNERVTRTPTAAGSIFGNATCLASGACQSLTVIPNLAAAGRTAIQNQVTLGTPAETAFSLIQAGTTGTVRFLPNPNTGVGNLLTNGGKFRYNALQAEVRRQATQGLYFQANYTFQKNLTNSTDDGINQNRVAPYLDNLNPDLDYARAPYDTAHSFNFNGIYELPFGRGKRFFDQGGFVNQLLGGFQVASIVQITSGPPISLLDARGTLNRAARSANQTAFTNLTKDQIKNLIGFRDTPNGLYFIDPAVISTTGRAANGFGSDAFPGQVFFNVNPLQTGNSERFFIDGPMFWNWDASVIKNFPIRENVRVQLRAEAFNVTNSTRFFVATNSGIFNVNSTNFGRLTSAYGPRIMQFVARFEF